MKRIYTIIVALLLTASVFAQAPEKMTYQAVIRNSSDQLITNQGIGMQISILQSTATGTAVYVETHNTTSNANGLVTVEIGNGTVVSGDFTTIDWANDTYFIKTETDPTISDGTNYTITGTSQLLSVAYALHAKTAESIEGTVNYTETDPVFTSSQANNITSTDITNLSNLSGTNTGDQDISGIATNTQAIQDTSSQIRADFPDVSGFISTETDPVFTSSQANNITSTDITNLSNLSGTNTGDQDISGKVDIVTGKGLSTNDYTNADATKLAAITGTNTGDQNITAMTHTNRTALDAVSGTNTGDQTLSGLGGVASNTSITGATKTKVTYDAKGLVTAGADATTADIAASTDKNYVTDAQLTVIGNTSNTNTGDQDITAMTHTNRTALDAVSGTNTGDQTLSGLGGVASNTAITGATKTKVTYDAKGLVTSGADATTADIAATTDKNYVTDAQLTVIGNTSNTNTGDETTSTIKTKLGITILSGTNTGDQDLSSLAIKVNVLELNNTTVFTPDADYEPATKKYVDDNASTTYTIGDFAQGGIVFWIDETGEHGLVCAKTDQSTGVRWYAGTYGYTQAKGNGPYAGEANTAIIIAAQVAIGDDNSTYAARICNELQITEGGKTYGDWYLPSKEELYLMYQNKTTIDATATANSGVAFATYYYWSSTEDSNGFAWEQYFGNGFQFYVDKNFTYYVRAVRAF